MINKTISLLAPVLLVAVAPTALQARAGSEAELTEADNAELAQMFEADQAIRMELMQKLQENPEDQQALAPLALRMMGEDSQRRNRLSAMLEAGEVRTARDYYHAAYIFQHGSQAPRHWAIGKVLGSGQVESQVLPNK